MCEPSKVEEKKMLSRNSNKLSILGTKCPKQAGGQAEEANRKEVWRVM